MSKVKHIRERFVKASNEAPGSSRFPGSGVVDTVQAMLTQVFESLPFFWRGWTLVVVLGNNGHAPSSRRRLFERLQITAHPAPPFPRSVRQVGGWVRRRALSCS